MQRSEMKTVRILDSKWYNFDLLSDARLRTADGCTFDVHRILLAGSSDYFATMFCSTNRREFTIPGISGECLSNILHYVYTGDKRVTERNVNDLMIAADYLLLLDLQRDLKHSIKAYITEHNCLIILEAAHQICDEDIFQECFRFIQTRFEEVVRCQQGEIADLPLEIFKSILSNRNLHVHDESTVWLAIVEWMQKYTASRMCYVPQLLLTLAMEDMGEELATEILQHEIVSKNCLMQDLMDIRSSDFSSNVDVLSSFLRRYSNHFTEPYSHRIPHHLYVILYHTCILYHENTDRDNLYITYDENPDLWRKITKVSFHPDYLIAIGHNIYIFNMSRCMNFDLSVMEWVTMEVFTHKCHCYFVVAVDPYIYKFGEDYQLYTHVVEVYDTVNNRWFNGVSPPTMCNGAFVALNKKIYCVGSCVETDDGTDSDMDADTDSETDDETDDDEVRLYFRGTPWLLANLMLAFRILFLFFYVSMSQLCNFFLNSIIFFLKHARKHIGDNDGVDDTEVETDDYVDYEINDDVDAGDVPVLTMMTQMFDPVTQQWSVLPPPTVIRSNSALVAYHHKIYMVGGQISMTDITNAEVFDPATNLWKELPNMPNTFSKIRAEVFNDQIIVYDNSVMDDWRNTESVRWNDAMECWEKLDETFALKDLHSHRFCSIDDADTIQMLMKQNRDPKTQMEKSLFT